MHLELSIFIILLISVICILYYILIYRDESDLIQMKSNIDNDIYIVRDWPDSIHAANLLAKIKQNIYQLIDLLNSKKETEYKNYEPYIDNLNRKIKNCIISENSQYNPYTSYSVSKGEKLVFCLREKNKNATLHDINLLMYVVLHEISHIACTEYGHTDLFKNIFAFFTKIAVENNLYTKIDFENSPKIYCGMTIQASII